MGKTGSATLVGVRNWSPATRVPSPALGSDQRHDTQESSKGIDFLPGVLGVHLTLLSKDAAFQRKR
jgi:hypothetical protein